MSMNVQASEVHTPICGKLTEAQGRAMWHCVRASTWSASTRPRASYGTNVRGPRLLHSSKVGDEFKPFVVTPTWRSQIT